MSKHRKGNNVSGWLIVDKPKGMGSTEVVNLTRRLFKCRKNGQQGPLDPFDTGVLPSAFGEANQLFSYVSGGGQE